jgi:hypothetical protein
MNSVRFRSRRNEFVPLLHILPYRKFKITESEDDLSDSRRGSFREGDFTSAISCHEQSRIGQKLVETRSVSSSNRSFRQIPVFSRRRSRHVSASLRNGSSERIGAEYDNAILGSDSVCGRLGLQAVAPDHRITPPVDQWIDTEGEIPRIGPA